MSLLGLAPALTRLADAALRPALTVDAGACLHAWNQASGCTRCTDLCPTGAITLDGGVAVATDACVRCGGCVHACPTGVFSGVDETPRLLQRVAGLGPVTALALTCGHFPTTTAAPDVTALLQTGGCLAALGPAAYVGPAALGVGRIDVHLHSCAGCPIGALRPAIAAAVAQAAELVATPIVVVDPLPAAAQPHPVLSLHDAPRSRRTLFRRVLGRATPTAPALDLEPGRPDGKAPPAPRRLLSHLLAQLPADRHAHGPVYPTLTVAPGCTACGVCATVCPTGALTFTAADDAFTLTLDPQACTGCDLCVELCAPGVLQPAAPAAWVESAQQALLTGALKHCTRCRAPFAGPGALCPTCDFRRRHPAGSLPRAATRPAARSLDLTRCDP